MRVNEKVEIAKELVTTGSEATVKNFASLALVTSSVEDHAHAVHAYIDSDDGDVVVGETSHSTGDAENKPPHAHPFTLNIATGELRIAEADDHRHSVQAADLAQAIEALRERLNSESMLRSDDRGPGMRQHKRTLRNTQVGFVSLCRRGMNGIHSVLKSDGRFSFSSSFSKMDKEGLLYNLVWVPDLPCHEGDAMTAEEVRKAAHGFLPNGGRIDIEHDGKPLDSDQVSIAEHYIVPSGDPKFQGIRTSEGAELDPTGAWGLILKIHDPDIRASYESGGWNGVSLAGRAEVMPVGKTKAASINTPSTEEDFHMTPEEMKALAEQIATGVTAGLTEILSKTAPKAPAKPDPVSPTSTIEVPADLDLNDPVALDAWQDQLFTTSLDMQNPADVAKLSQHRRKQADAKAKVEKAEADATAKAEADAKAAEGAGADDDELTKAKAEVEAANARVEKLEKASRQPVKTDDKPASQVSSLNKSEADQWQIGKDLAQRLVDVA